MIPCETLHWAVGLWGCGAVGLWGCGAVGLWGCGAVGLWLRSSASPTRMTRYAQ